MSEFLKQLAEELGYKTNVTQCNDDGSVAFFDAYGCDNAEFDPYQNAEQRWEVLEWLLDKGMFPKKFKDDICGTEYVIYSEKNAIVAASTLTNALMEAAKKEIGYE